MDGVSSYSGHEHLPCSYGTVLVLVVIDVQEQYFLETARLEVCSKCGSGGEDVPY